MTAVTTGARADAPSHAAVAWHAIDWRKAHRNVRRLQVRIVKATQAGKWHKVRGLQRLLAHSFSGRVLAVRRVTENQGQRTAGVDGELWDTPAKKAQGVERLKQRRYRAQPLRRSYIPKQEGKKKRALGIPTMLDRAHQAVHLLALDPVAETTGDPDSYGFRRERAPADAIAQLFNLLRQKGSARWILEGDIRACFDELDHNWMGQHIPIDKHSLRQWLKAGYIEKDVFHRTEAGAPQGGVISPVLANMALDGLEDLLRQHFPPRSGKKVYLVRFADDFVITAISREVLEAEVLPVVQAFLQERGLTLSLEKTVITHMEAGFDFLGQNIRKYDGKLLIKPAPKSQRAIRRKIRHIIHTEGRHLSAAQLIGRLNPVIRGWANYHRHVVSKRVFAQLDHYVYRTLWRWARRRHRNKSAAWIYQKYFTDRASQRSVFHAQTTQAEGKKITLRLCQAARIPIRRHIKVRMHANPYDPAWEMYFEQRQHHKVVDELRDRPGLLLLWQRQQGRCPICGELITQETGWHDHHLQGCVYGGGNELANRVLLHPNCHRQVHSPDYNGPSPRPSRGVRDA